MKPVENERSMFADGACDFFHGLNARSHDLGAPLVEELSSPKRRNVGPELIKLFAKQISAYRFEVILE